MPISTRIQNASLSVMYKIVTDTAPAYLCDLIIKEKQDRPYNLRQRKALVEPFCRLEIYKKSSFPRTVHFWNNLPIHVQSADSLEIFKQFFKPVLTDRILLYYYGER